MVPRLVEPETESHTSREAGTMPRWPLALIAMAVRVVTGYLMVLVQSAGLVQCVRIPDLDIFRQPIQTFKIYKLVPKIKSNIQK